MTIILDRKTETPIECSQVTIVVGGKEFRIRLDGQWDLHINKMCFGNESAAIRITPNVSNHITIQ
jgi:hypothetical protein